MSNDLWNYEQGNLPEHEPRNWTTVALLLFVMVMLYGMFKLFITI